ncbi:hypothetical protein BLNAU_19346 [Blattamonas nauphoetae]|uniref:Uncharacterized protein n=1 Tax=Blattamonas nauphoetae TaxID=2049346 RepID=A0ABQ9X2C5_9EUKA|nr:hypothetical protein BLNAU_19346 [Blattamonas nauphoetae]
MTSDVMIGTFHDAPCIHEGGRFGVPEVSQDETNRNHHFIVETLLVLQYNTVYADMNVCLSGLPMRPALNIEERGFFIVVNTSFTLASLSLRPTHLLAQITNTICSLSNCDLHVSTTSPFVAVSSVIRLKSLSFESDTGTIDSVVTSRSQNNTIHMLASSLWNMTVMSGDSFFGGNKTDSRLSSTTIWNVTRPSLTASPEVSVADRTMILGSEFGYVWNGIVGTIVRRFCRTPRFLAQNTTFHNGVYEEKEFTSPQTLSDISNTFIKCNFSDCSSSSSGGSLSASYTALSSSIDLILKDCKFSDSESDKNGGAIAIILDGSNHEECCLNVNIEYCNFSNTTARSGEGGAIFINVQGDTECDGSFVMNNSIMSNCNSKMGGCIRSYIFTTLSVSFLMDNCSFSHINAEKGGAIAHETFLSSKSSFTVEHCYFSECSSNNGGSLMFIIHEYLKISIAHTHFKRSSSTEYGGCISIEHRQSASNLPFSVVFSDIDIVNSSATHEGGFLYLYQDHFTVEEESTISCDHIVASRCSAGHYGGFFSFSETKCVNLSISSSTFQTLYADIQGAFMYCSDRIPRDPHLPLTISISNVTISDLTSMEGCLFCSDATNEQSLLCLTLNNVTVTKFYGSSTACGALIHFYPSNVHSKPECVIKNCHFIRDSSTRSSVICQHDGTLRLESTIILDQSAENEMMLKLTPNTTLSLNKCQLMSSASRKKGQKYNLISGPIGQASFIECSEVVFSVHSPTCDGYLVLFDSLPTNVKTLFESCVDTSTETSFSSLVDKDGAQTFSIASDNLEVYVDEERGHDSNMCGFPSHPCRSIGFSSLVSPHLAFPISAVGVFSSPVHPIVLSSPCMCLTSNFSTNESRATLKFTLSTDPILQAPDNPFELSNLVLILNSNQNDGVFFKIGQSSTRVRNIIVHYTGQHRILLFLLAHISNSTFEIDLDSPDLPLTNIVLFSSNSAVSIVERSTFQDLVLSGSSTFLGTSKRSIIMDSSFKTIKSTEPLFRLSSSELDLNQALFEFCQVESDALIVVDEGSILTVHSSTFESCTGREAGVALFTPNRNKAFFTEVNLINNRVSRQNSDDETKTSLFGNDLTIRSNPQLVNISNSRSSSFFPRVVVGDSDRSDTIRCGSEIDACCTLQYTIGVTNETNAKEWMTTLCPFGPFSEVSVFVVRRSIVIDGRGLCELDAPCEGDEVVFSVEDSSVIFRQIVFRLTRAVYGRFIWSSKSALELMNCSVSSFIPVSAVSSPDSSIHSLFSAESGSFIVSGLRCDNFQSTEHSSTLLIDDRADFNLRNTTLSSLSAVSKNGLMCGTVQHSHFDIDDVLFEALQTPSNCGMLNLEVIDDGSVSLRHTTFSNLNISSPLISLTLSSSLHVTAANSIVVDVSSLLVRSCRGSDVTGSVLFVDNPQNMQWTLSEPTTRQFLTEIEWDSFVEKRGADEARSLFDDRIPVLPQYFVDENVLNDVINCGTEFLPCRSIEFAVGRIHPHRTNAVGVLLISSVDLKEQLSDRRCWFVDGSGKTVTIVGGVVDSGGGIVVRERFELLSIVVSLPANSKSLGKTVGIIECCSGTLSMRQVAVLQTTMSDDFDRVIVFGVDAHVSISDCELSRLSTAAGMISLTFTSNTKTPSFLFRNVSFVNCQPSHAVRIALTFSPEHVNVKMRDHFEKIRLDWKHPEWYWLRVGEKEWSFVFDVVVHPAIWVGLGIAGLLALLIVYWFLCTPAMFPVMMCCRHVRNKPSSSCHCRCCKCLLPDGGRGQNDHEPWDAIALLNGIPNEYRYATITDAKTRQLIDEEEEEGEQPIGPTHHQRGLSEKLEVDVEQAHQSNHPSSDSDSQDILDSSDESEEEIV